MYSAVLIQYSAVFYNVFAAFYNVFLKVTFLKFAIFSRCMITIRIRAPKYLLFLKLSFLKLSFLKLSFVRAPQMIIA